MSCLGTIALLLLLALCTSSARAGASDDLRDISIQLKWYHQFQFAGYYAAEKMGYYRAEGLRVTLVEGNADRPPITQVVSGETDFGVSDADVLLAYLRGEPVVAVATIFQHSPYILMTRANSGLRTPTDLRGKKIMLADEQGIAQLKAVLQREGMSLDAVTIVPHQWDNDVLIRGEVDAISAYLTVEPYQMRRAGVEPGVIRAMDYGVDFYGDTLFTTPEMAKEEPELVEAVRRATIKGWQYAMAHPDELIEYIVRLPGVTERGITRDHLQYEAQMMRDLIVPDLVDIGHMNPGRWETMARIYGDIGLIDGRDADIDGFLFRGKASAAWVMPALLSTSAAAMLALIIVAWNVQLRRTVSRRTAELQAQMEYRRQATTQLYFFKCLMDQSHDPFYIIDPTRGYRLVYANAAACHHFGMTMERLLRTSIPDWNPDLSLAKCDRLLERLRRRNSVVFETRHRTDDGRIVPVDVSANYIVYEDREYIAGHFRDISQQKRDRAALKEAKQRAEHANSAKDQFLAALSHELRTPLTPVLAEVSAMSNDPRTPEDLRPVLEMIERNVNLEARLIDDLLDLTRVTRGKLHLYRKQVDIHAALERTIEICRPDVKRKRLRVVTNFEAAAHIANIDEARMQQVFWNLLKNATKFTPEGGTISIATRNATASEGRSLLVSVSDSGIGMSGEQLQKVFHAFEQTDPSIGRQFGGLGLGLTISQSIVEAHGGTIAAYSDGPGFGSTFTVTLHAVEACVLEKTEPVIPDLARATDRKLNILLVEDNEDTLRIMARLLGRHGRTIHTAASLADARLIASRQPLDLVISDIGLPDGSGLDLMRDVPMGVKGIALSGYGMEDDIVRSREAGFCEHLTKPVDFRRLEQVVRQHAR